MNPNTKNLRIFLAPLAALVSLTLSTCTEPVSTQCPTGVVCPAGKKCAAKQPVCIVENCGDGVMQDGELCDDGNIVSGDGCSFDCLSTESCGNGVTDVFLVTDSVTGAQKPKEACDDGNTADGDGCSADCQSNELCGNGILDKKVGEICDDGNRADGDGCSGNCLSNETCGNGYADIQLTGEKKEFCDDGNAEAGDGCTPDCKSKEECGNGYVDFNESCDDGNRTSGDGCSADCRSDESCGNHYIDTFIDSTTGKPKEACDDGNNISGDGCSDTCKSKEECGNGILDSIRINPETGEVETLEVCDDGNRISGDRCSADCKSTESCGNGYIDAVKGELCDDGNNESGDGCSSDCKSTEYCGNRIVDAVKLNPETNQLEPFEICDDGNNVSGDGCSPDCKSNETCGNGVVDEFIVAGTGKPKEVCDDGDQESGDGCSADCKSEEFCSNSYVDVEEQCDSGGYDTPVCDSDCTIAFCGDGYSNVARGEQCDDAGDSPDCDQDCTLAVCGDRYWNANAGEQCDTGGDSPFCDSDCTEPRCGDGHLNLMNGEVCDDGDNESGDGCSANCKSKEVCGNGYVDSYLVLNPATGKEEPAEVCDDGNNTSGDNCSANCDSDETCGNGRLDTAKGEICDDGNNLDGDGCAGNCKSGEGCGNGILDVGEQCEDGNLFNTDDCVSCRSAYCGDGFVNLSLGPNGQSKEQCDTAGPSRSCNANCTVSRCGDGVVNPAADEQCDTSGESASCDGDCTVAFCGDGTINSARGEQCDDSGPSKNCNSDCTVNFCGDGKLNTVAGEQCDPGASRETRYCDSDCTPSSCGDGVVNATAGEACDDGNSRNDDACRIDCQFNVCGDGIVNAASNPSTGLPYEACDDGNTITETSCPYGIATCTNFCNATCSAVLDLKGAWCGNGAQEEGEVCDDGNTVTETECVYGTPECTQCDSTCKTSLALRGRYCGDTVVSNGETCDDGNNVTETKCPYGQLSCSACSADCSVSRTLSGSICGDGTVDSEAGEKCDDGNAVTELSCPYGTPECHPCDASCSTVLNLFGNYCGDSRITDGETCDDGNGVTETECAYGTESCAICEAGCRSSHTGTGRVCGDNVVDPEEGCDDGNTVDETACAYGTPTCPGCSATCTALALFGPYCGNSTIDGAFGEVCDDGNTVTETECAYGTESCLVCTADCRSNPQVKGHYCGDGLVTSDPGHVEVCDDANPSCGSCNVGCTAIELVAARGTITVNGTGGLSGNTFTLSDGVNAPVTFEYDTNHSVGPGNVEVYIKNQNANSVAATTADVISKTTKPLDLTATAANNVVTIVNERLGVIGNQTISKTITATTWLVSGMAGGRGRDCAQGQPCRYADDCSAGLSCDTLSNTCELPSFAVSVTLDGNGSGSVTSDDTHIDCGATCGFGYQSGDVVLLTAAPNEHSDFAGWSGGCTGTEPTCEIVVSAATSVTASFTAKVYSLTAAKAGAGSGTVTSSVGGINCGSACAANLTALTEVTLTAAPNATSSFAGWSAPGCPGTGTCTVTLDASKTVTATFDEVRYTLGVSKAGDGTGSVSSSPAGITCGADCDESYLVGASVTLTATADSGSAFTGWSDSACPGTGTCVVTVDAAKSVTATFTKLFDLSVTTSGTGTGTVATSPAGTSCGAGCQTYLSGTVVSLTPTEQAGSAFAGWTGACSGMGSCQVTMNAAKSVEAIFELAYTLTVTSTAGGVVSSLPAGIDCGGALSDCSEEYVTGASVTLTAVPDAGMLFTGWTGACSGTETCTVAMTEARSVGASFATGLVLTVVPAGTGTGTVTSVPPGIDCGSTCTASFAETGSVVLTATAASGSVFVGWSGAGCSGTGTCTVTMDAAKSVTATFELLNRLTVITAGAGTVSSSPTGIDCGTVCSHDFSATETVTLTATPIAPEVFAGWSGDCTGTGSCIVVMNQARNVTAAFSLCGNGALNGSEGCDDGNVASNDGCSAACAVETGMACSGVPATCYPIIAVDGVKEASWSTTVVKTDASSVGQSMAPGERISNVLIANDSTNLYIAVEAFDDLSGDELQAYLHFYFIKNGAEGTVTADNLSGTVTFSSDSVNPSYIGHSWFKSGTGTTDGFDGVVTAGKASAGFAEVMIPLSALGTPAKGQTLGLIVGYRPEQDALGFSDIAPYKASAVNANGGAASAVNPAANEYFSYTVR